MKGITICLLLFLVRQGNTATECNTIKERAIQCKFTNDISSTKTSFAVYFLSQDGKKELLIDCVWVDDKLECIEQIGFECQQPVSNIAEISVPPRFTSKPGSYLCLLEGHITQDSKPCHFFENQHKNQTELVEDNVDVSHPDQKEKGISTTTIFAISGTLLGCVAIGIVTVILVRRWKTKNYLKHEREKSYQFSKIDIMDMDSRLADERGRMHAMDRTSSHFL
ncbi:uncharacterized protein LOC112568397 isoform X2 [Pomacea canaliculata]|nr:uncharacterized protein LOC112568397 isoform X2 [Pomacea canaliculata]